MRKVIISLTFIIAIMLLITGCNNEGNKEEGISLEEVSVMPITQESSECKDNLYLLEVAIIDIYWIFIILGVVIAINSGKIDRAAQANVKMRRLLTGLSVLLLLVIIYILLNISI